MLKRVSIFIAEIFLLRNCIKLRTSPFFYKILSFENVYTV